MKTAVNIKCVRVWMHFLKYHFCDIMSFFHFFFFTKKDRQLDSDRVHAVRLGVFTEKKNVQKEA